MQNDFTKQVVQSVAKSGGSAEAIFCLSRKWLLATTCVLSFMFLSCFSHLDGTSSSSNDVVTITSPAEPLTDARFAVGTQYNNTHVNARVIIKSVPDSAGTIDVAIGINGSQQLIAKMSVQEFGNVVVLNSDWQLSTAEIKIQ